MGNGSTRAPSLDAQTLQVYVDHREDYIERIGFNRSEPDDHMRQFVAALPPGDAPVLDWGAGTGETASLLTGLGLKVEATDASPEMAEIAKDLGVEIRIEPFEALDPATRFRGVWSNVALCHASRDVFSDLVGLAASALVDGGVLYLNVKHGSGERRDRLGRFFSYWTEDDLRAVTERAGLETIFSERFESVSFTEDSETHVIQMSRKPVD